MKRDVGGVLLILLGIMVVRIVVSGQYLYYVAEAMSIWLLISGGILAGLGAAVLWDSWREGRQEPSAAAPTLSAAVGQDGNEGDAEPFASGADTSAVTDTAPDPDHDAHAEHGGPRIAYLLLLPVLAVYVVAPAALGSYTAARQEAASLPPSADLGVYPLPPGDPVEVTLRDYVTRAVWDAGRTLEGRSVSISGFTTDDPAGGWWLSRMGMSCCAADAQAYRVKVSPVPDLPADTWVRVTGTWAPGGSVDDPVPNLVATDVEQIAQPRNPYQ